MRGGLVKAAEAEHGGDEPITYTATISHHSIARARSIAAPTLAEAKTAADAEFGEEMREYSIIITNAAGAVVARRLVSESAWTEEG